MKRAGDYWAPDREELQLEALAAGGWQLDHLAAALEHVTDWSCAVDGGAHVGSWTRAMAERFSRVVAFEPARDTFEALEMNLREWAIAHQERNTRVELRRYALGAAPAFMGMADDGKYHGGNTGGRYLFGHGDVEVVTLDSFELEELGFLKLDIEGFELFALQGAGDTLRRCRPVVMIEDKIRMAHRFGLQPHAAAAYLQSLGMRQVGNVGADLIFTWG